MAFRRVDIAESVENISNVQDERALVNRSIQIALERVFEYYDWPYYIQDKGVIKTTDDYTTGTIAITNGSADIVGTDTVWTAGMVGRKIRFNGENPYYRIKTFTDATHLTLENPYQGTTDTDATYVIYQDEYRLASDVDKYKLLRQAQNNVSIFSLHPSRFDERFPMPQGYADPVFEIMEGTLLDTYTTGTVTLSGTTVSGAGSPGWTSVEGLGRMSVIRIGNNVYHIKSVNSDTQLTTYETMTTLSIATAYEITLNNLRVQLYQIPNAQRLIYYRYFRRPAPLANDYDIPDMPHSFHWILIYGSLGIVLMQKGDINKAQREAEARFIDGLNQMKQKIGSFTPDRIYQKQSMDRIRTHRHFTDGLEKASFDRRYSSP